MTDQLKQKILRIGVIRGGKIIEERLIRKRSTVLVGTGTRNNIVLPATNAPKSFSLFELRGNDYFLAFTDDMAGRLSVGEKAADLQSLKAHYHLKLNENSRGRVSVGECIILFQFVAPPPEPVRPQLPVSVRGYWMRNIDWPYSSTLGVTLACMLVLWIWAGQIPVVDEDMGIDDIPDRFAKMVMPDKLMEEDDEEGDGAGEEEAPKPKKKAKEEEDEGDGEGDSEEARAASEAARRARIEKKVSGRGLLKVLGARGGGISSGGAVADVFGEGSVGGSGDGAFDGIGGLDVATASGQKGQRGMDGAGSAASIEDMGTRGVVGKAGKGSRGKREARVVARVSSAALQEFDSDSRSQNDIKKVIRRRLGGIKHCYEKRLKRNPDLKGKIVVRFVIHPGGKVIEVEVVENTTGDRELGQCIAARVRSVRFPPADGGETSVVYPFILAPGG
jgi:TonB family protein